MSILNPPANVSYELLGLGNIIKLKFSKIDDAYAYAIEKYDEILDKFILLGITRTNEFIDYSNPKNSTNENTILIRYRIATIGSESEIYDTFSSIVSITIPKIPNEFTNLVEIEGTESDAVIISDNKEDKLLYHNANKLEFYKLSTLEFDETKNSTGLYLSTESLGDIKKVTYSNDNQGFYMELSNGLINKYDQSSLKLIYTLPTINKDIKDISFNITNTLFGLIETVFGEDQIVIYDITDNVVRVYFKPLIIKNDTGKILKIMDFKIVGDTIFVLDEEGVLSSYTVDFKARTINLHSKIFTPHNYVDEYNHFYKRAALMKTYLNILIDDTTIITTDTAKEQVKALLLSSYEVIDATVGDYRNNLKIYATTNKPLTDLVNLTETYIDTIMDYIGDHESNPISPSDWTNLIIEMKASEVINLYNQRNHAMLSLMLDATKNYLTECKMHYSELYNQVIVSSPFFFKIVDLEIYKVNNVFDCVTPSYPISNYVFNEIYSESDQGSHSQFDSFLHDEVERFIGKIDINPELSTAGILFNDVLFQPIYNNATGAITYDYGFQNKYIDFYKFDITGVESEDISPDVSNDLGFSYLRGFGYPLIYNFSNNSILNVNNYYFYKDKCYFCNTTRLTSDRTEPNIAIMLADDIAGGYLTEVTGAYLDSMNFVSRLNITSRTNTSTNDRIENLFAIQDIDTVTTIDPAYTFFTGKTLFTSNVYNSTDIDFGLDKAGQSCFVISVGSEPNAPAGHTFGCFYLYSRFYPDTSIIFTPNLIFNRKNYYGTFTKDIRPTDESFMFLVPYQEQSGDHFLYYLTGTDPDFVENKTRKLKVNSTADFFGTLTAVYVVQQQAQDVEKPDIIIYNDFQSSKDELGNFYGNSKMCTWRWENDTKELLDHDYVAFRVSIDKAPWIYLPKKAKSYSGKDFDGDGMHTFFIQYQKPDGTWSVTYSAKYYLKTLRPDPPVLTKIESSKYDRGKPILYWSKEPDIMFYNITYNNKINYYNIKEPFHSPNESYSTYNSNIENISVNVYAYDKYGNISDGSDWLFTVNSYLKEPLDIFFDRYTSNVRPTITWKPKTGESLTSFYYSFDNATFIKTNDLFATPASNLKEGVHSFEIYALDALQNETLRNVYYFEIKTTAPNTPIMVQETLDRTINCSPNTLFFNFEYDLSKNKSYYSFDNFKNEYEFFGFHLDLTKAILPAGNNTIYIKYLDKYHNYSNVLEYTFYLDKNSLIAPQFIPIDKDTSNKRPIWFWKNLTKVEHIEATFFKNGVQDLKIDKIYGNSWKPDFDLEDGTYELKIVSIDKFGNKSVEVGYSVVVNDKLPSKPNMNNVKQFGNSVNVFFDKPKDGSLYGSLINFSEDNKRKPVAFKSTSEGEFKFMDLKEGNSYILEVYNYGMNSLKSQAFIYYFTIPNNESKTELFIVNKDDLEIQIRYYLGSGKYEIAGIKNFEYNDNYLQIDGLEFPNNIGVIDQSANNIGFKTETYKISSIED